jgi:two-component system CitB family response regulator
MSDFTVLVVDDDFRIADLHASIADATPRFRSVGTVGTVAGALRLADAERPDLILLDAYLPDGSGLELLRRVDSDAVMVTASNDAATVRRALRHGAFSYLIKPFEPEALAGRLRSYAAYRDALGVPAGSLGGAGGAALDQAALDAALAASRPAALAAARSRGATEQAVLDALVSSGASQSAPSIAELVGVSRATAQRYLGTLAAAGLVDVQLKYGATGRPEHRYSAV